MVTIGFLTCNCESCSPSPSLNKSSAPNLRIDASSSLLKGVVLHGKIFIQLLAKDIVTHTQVVWLWIGRTLWLYRPTFSHSILLYSSLPLFPYYMYSLMKPSPLPPHFSGCFVVPEHLWTHFFRVSTYAEGADGVLESTFLPVVSILWITRWSKTILRLALSMMSSSTLPLDTKR